MLTWQTNLLKIIEVPILLQFRFRRGPHALRIVLAGALLVIDGDRSASSVPLAAFHALLGVEVGRDEIRVGVEDHSRQHFEVDIA